MASPLLGWAGPPAFLAGLLGYRTNGNANTSDGNNTPSINIARTINDLVGVPPTQTGPRDPGAALEHAVCDWLTDELGVLAPTRQWEVDHQQVVSSFQQYSHLARLQAIIRADKTDTLKAEIGADYMIRPDVTVGVVLPDRRMLHASVSCKWTVRSDRVQNIRHEAVILTRHRRGRQPHIVVVTAEPLPSRIAAIARGTGEVDGVYHVALPHLREAVDHHGSLQQKNDLAELVGQDRLFDLGDLPGVLVA